MKREAPTHTKMKRLCRMLDIPLYQAVGIFELLIHMTARERPRGDLGNGNSNEDIAIAIDWRGDPDRLIDALVHCGFLERHPEYRLVVHDWDEHAEDSIDLKLARAVLTYATGQWPRMTRIAQKERKQLEQKFREKYGPRPDAQAHKQAECAHAVRTESHEKPPERHYQALPSLALPSQSQDTPTPTPLAAAATPAAAETQSSSPNGRDVCVCSGSELKSKKAKAKTKMPPPEDAYVAYWNRHCAPLGQVVDFTAELRDQLQARIEEGTLTPQKFADVLREIHRRPFAMGEGQNGWVIDFNYLIANTKNCISSLLNGGYGKRKPPPRPKKLEDSLSNNQQDMYRRGEAEYAKWLNEQRERAKKDQDARWLAECDRLEAEAKQFFAWLARRREQEAADAAADAAFLKQCGIEGDHANA